MSLFSRLKDAFTKADDQTKPTEGNGLEDVRKEMRMHTRYSVSFYRNAIAQVNEAWVGRIMDLSYGGAAIKFEFPNGMPAGGLTLENEIQIDILGHKQKFQTKTVRTVPQGDHACFVGVCFHHATPETLIYLREIIEPMRQGLSLDTIPAHLRADKYKDKNWHCFRGEGPVDVAFKLDSGTVSEGLITFKMSDLYFEVAINGGVLQTARSADKAGRASTVGAQMIPTATPDNDTLRRAFLILASTPASVSELSAPLLQMVDQQLQKKEKGAA